MTVHRLPHFSPGTVKSHQDFTIRHNKHPLPEKYRPEVKEKLFRKLDAEGVAYPPIEDEAHANRMIRTTYASVDKRAGTLIVGLDNAAYHDKRYEGLSRGERRFAEDMAEYAKAHHLTTIFMCHVPPTAGPKGGTQLPTRQEGKELRHWMNGLQRKFPDSLWVHGHKHPKRTELLDLDGAAGGREVSNVVLAGQAKDSLTKITTCEHGRKIEEYRLVGHGEHAQFKRISSVALDRNGKRVDPERHDLGRKKGVLFGVSDVHHENDLEAYYRALKSEAAEADRKGLAVSYLDVGDHTVKHGRIPVDLPRRGRTFFVPGNHDYYNHGNLGQVVDSFQPKGERVPFRIDYLR